MQLSDLDFQYPPELVATEPARPSRVALNEQGRSREVDIPRLLEKFHSGDTLVINESKVIPARIFAADQLEILFLKSVGPREWEVLFPARAHKLNAQINLPGGVTATLTQKGLPQRLTLSREVDHTYFEEFGEMALPPYIQEARGERRNREIDLQTYQTTWAQNPGSVAAPTASLHFTNEDLEYLQARGVHVCRLTLHVGAGTFLPVRTENLDEHVMHAEDVDIPIATLERVRQTFLEQKTVWALGTTVARALEAWAHGHFHEDERGARGATRLFIRPGFEFKIVGALLTNFHQPRSTLLSLVAAFAGLQSVKQHYAWAIEHRFRLFSYGDLSAWIR